MDEFYTNRRKVCGNNSKQVDGKYLTYLTLELIRKQGSSIGGRTVCKRFIFQSSENTARRSGRERQNLGGPKYQSEAGSLQYSLLGAQYLQQMEESPLGQ